jgi:hypothetical protein
MNLRRLIYVYVTIPSIIVETVGDDSVGVSVIVGCSSGDGMS